MIIPPVVDRKFALYKPYVDVLESQVESSVFAFCKANKFAYTARTKDVASLAEKIESGRYGGWAELDDLFACTVIIPTLAREETVLEFLGHAFKEIRTTRRGQVPKPPDVFRFDATRFIGQLRQVAERELPEEIFSLNFEVQIRSAFEHAWSVTTHALSYKTDQVDWAHMRLAAQLKAAVEQLDSLILTYDQAATGVSVADWPEIQSKTEIASQFKRLVQEGKIPSEVAAKDWSRFSDNIYALLQASPDWPGSREKRFPFIASSLKIVTEAVEQLDSKTFPRSISLHQLVLGVLAQQGRIRSPLRRFVPIITEELQALYPTVGALEQRFQF